MRSAQLPSRHPGGASTAAQTTLHGRWCWARTIRAAAATTLPWLILVAAASAWFPASSHSRGFGAAQAAGLSLWGLGAFLMAVRLSYAAWVGWPIALAGLLAIQYSEVTPPSVRQHDVEGHREYIEHLTAHRDLPAVQQGWETWQPPLYYIAAALWRAGCSGITTEDSFRSVQRLAAVLYVAVVVLALVIFRRLGLNSLEAAGAGGLLALLPGNLFFAARINNDVLLPILGLGVMWAAAEFVRTGAGRWLCWLALLLPALLAAKGSSLAIVGGVLALVCGVEARRAGWRAALVRGYLTALPAALWQCFWWVRTAAQTGNPLYVNAALPENLRVHAPAWHRLLSFDLSAFLGGGYYYDEPVRQSYPTALVTSLLYGEYGMQELPFRFSELLRWGCLGMLLVLAAGVLVAPRRELKALWVACVVMVCSQAAITTLYAVQFPFACNQNMRFLAPAFVPLAGLFGFGAGHFWTRAGLAGRVAFVVMAGAFVVGLADFYFCLLF